MRFKFFLLYFIVTVICYQVTFADENEDTFAKANRLFFDNKIAEAAIEYSKAKRDPYVSPPNRAVAQEQLEKCMTVLRVDPHQSDKFYSLISHQKDNQIMQYLMYQYASLLESQGRYNELIKIHRQLYRLYPSASQKYTLSRKLQQAGAVDEAFELYQDLVENKQYHRIALRHILENIGHAGVGKIDYFHDFFRLYEKEIASDFQLFTLAVSALVELKQSKKALEYSFQAAEQFPHYIESLSSIIYRQYKKNNITSDDLNDLIEENRNRLTDGKRYFIAKLYGKAGEYRKALNILGSSSNLKMLEYRAQLLYSSGEYAKAAELYKTMVNKNKTREMWLIKLAEISFKLGDDQQAVSYLDDYINLKGGANFNTYFYVGKTLERYGMADKAKEVYLKGKELSSNKTYAMLELIKYYINQNQFYDAAYEIYESQLTRKLAPKSIYLSLARIIKDRKQLVSLMNNLEQIVIDKQTQETLTEDEVSNLNYCVYTFYSEIGNMEKAVEFFKIYFAAAPDNHNQLIEFCNWLESRGFYRKNIELLGLMPDTSPFFRQALSKRAEIMVNVGEPEKAVELLERYPNKRDNFLLAKAYLHSGNISKAKTFLSKVDYKSPDYFLLEGDIFLREHDVKSAVLAYQHISSSEGNIYQSALLREGLANIFYREYDEALLVFDKIIKASASSEQAVKSLKYRTMIALLKNTENEDLMKKWSAAEFMLWSGKNDEAIKLFDEIISFNQTELYVPELRIILYETFLSSGDTERAIGQLEKITSGFPGSSYARMAGRTAIELKSKVTDDFNIAEHYGEFLNSYPISYDSDIIRNELKQIGLAGEK